MSYYTKEDSANPETYEEWIVRTKTSQGICSRMMCEEPILIGTDSGGNIVSEGLCNEHLHDLQMFEEIRLELEEAVPSDGLMRDRNGNVLKNTNGEVLYGVSTAMIVREFERRKGLSKPSGIACLVVGCAETVARDDLCGDHYNEMVVAAALEADKYKPTSQQLKKMAETAKQLESDAIDTLINLEWWFETYGEEEKPAKFMNPDYLRLLMWDPDCEECDPPSYYHIEKMAALTKSEAMLLNERLKEMDGEPVNGGTHIWKFVGRQAYKREGQQNHFACVPVEDVK